VRKIWDIHGGVHPPQNKTQSLQDSLKDAPLPSLVVLPLSMHVGAPAIPCVAVGDKVKRGQMVAEPSGGFSAAIHASISGEVIALEDRPISHPSGNPGRAIVIQGDGLDESVGLNPIEDYRQVQPADLVARVNEAGIAGLGGAGFPTHIKLKPISSVDTLIINGSECEPYITADHCLMREFPDQVIQGVQVLAYILGEPKQVLIGIEDNKPDAIEALKNAADGTQIEVVSIPTKYPSGGEKQLIQILTGLEVASGKLPANLGIMVQNPGTAVAVLDAVTKGQVLTSRITTIVGENIEQSGNYRVRIGTTLAELLPQLGLDVDKTHKMVLGGPMMGLAMPDLNTPVLKITNCVLVPSAAELPDPEPAQACIRCGSCAEVCPAQLLPQQLFWFAQAEDHHNLQNHNLFDCIECGACSYVCPSNIPLVQYYRASKGAIREADREHIASDRARRRFEVRNERIEREAQEREAKRAARMQAAKEKQAASRAVETDEDMVAAAMARVKAQSAQEANSSSNDQAIQIQRQSLQDRVESLQIKIKAVEPDIDIKPLESELANAKAQLQRFEDQNPVSEEEANQSPASKPETQDSASAAIERAKQKALLQGELSESEKLAQSLESLTKRISKAEDRVKMARLESTDTLEALENGLEKLLAKQSEAQARLTELQSEQKQEQKKEQEAE
jgi:electron transport complex protein RnfC